MRTLFSKQQIRRTLRHNQWLAIIFLLIPYGLMAQAFPPSPAPLPSLLLQSANSYSPLLEGQRITEVPHPLSALPHHQELHQRWEAVHQELRGLKSVIDPEDYLMMTIQIQFHLNQLQDVASNSERFLRTYRHHLHAPWIYYFQNKALFLLEKPLAFDLILQKKLLKELPAIFQTDFLITLSRAAEHRKDFYTAITYLITEKQSTTSLQKTTDNDIFRLMAQLSSVEDLRKLQTQYENLSFIQEEISYLYLELLFRQQQYQLTTQLVKQLRPQVEQAANEAGLQRLTALETKLKQVQYLKPYRVGVILPMNSSFAKIAQLTQETLQGLRLALLAPPEQQPALLSQSGNTTYLPMKPNNANEAHQTSPIELVIRDSGLNPDQTEKVTQELIDEEHVIAIIGPLTRKTSEAAAKIAQQREVPLISLSLTPSITEVGSYVFRNHRNWEQEIKQLVHYAIETKKIKDYWILHPDTDEGRQKMSVFWDQVLQNGGHIRGIETFKRREKTFVPQFESLTGIHRPQEIYLGNDALQSTLFEGDEFADIDHQDQQIQLKLEQDPIYDAAALFLPTGNAFLPELQAILPYPAAYKMPRLTLLGDHGWNVSSVVLALERAPNHAFFADSFFSNSDDPVVEHFVQLYERYYYESLSYRKISSYTAFAYDTLRILSLLLQDTTNHNHQALRAALQHLPPYSGVTGTITFSHEGEALRVPKVLKARRGQLSEVF